jgi:hypothetical protein
MKKSLYQKTSNWLQPLSAKAFFGSGNRFKSNSNLIQPYISDKLLNVQQWNIFQLEKNALIHYILVSVYLYSQLVINHNTEIHKHRPIFSFFLGLKWSILYSMFHICFLYKLLTICLIGGAFVLLLVCFSLQLYFNVTIWASNDQELEKLIFHLQNTK